MRRFVAPVLLAMSAAAGSGCGEKIAIPEAVGIPILSDYVEQIPWQLTDPIDVIEAAGRVYVLEQATGTLTKFSTQQQELAKFEGLVSPTSMTRETTAPRMLVAESDGAGTAAVSIFDLVSLAVVGRVDLSDRVRSLLGLASDGTWLYASDPDSGVVHRFSWVSEAEGWLVAQGLVTANVTPQGGPASEESPNFVFAPMGLALDAEGFLLICDADTTRNWVVRFDPAPPVDDPQGRGQAATFRTIVCPTPPPAGFALGNAPDCGEPFVAGPSDEPGGLYRPTGAAFDTEGRIYVADYGNGRVQRFGPDGIFDLVIGQGIDGVEGVDGLGQPARLATWLGTASRDGEQVKFPGARVYVVDRERAQIRIFEDSRLSDFQDDN